MVAAEGVTFGAATNTVTGELDSIGVSTVARYSIWTASGSIEDATFNVTDNDGLDQDVTVSLPNTGAETNDDGLAIRTALANNSSINSVYDVSGFSDTIILTQRVNNGDLQPVLSIKSISAGNSLQPNNAFAPVVRTQGVAATIGKLDKDEFQITNGASKAGFLVVRVSDNTGLGNTDVVVNGITTSDSNTQIAVKVASKLATDSRISSKYNVTSVGDKVFLESNVYGPNAITVSVIN